MEIMLLTAMLASVSSLIAIVFDQMKHSRCSKNLCCGCIDVQRDVIDDDSLILF